MSKIVKCQYCQNWQECLNYQKWKRCQYLSIAKIAPSASIVYHFLYFSLSFSLYFSLPFLFFSCPGSSIPTLADWVTAKVYFFLKFVSTFFLSPSPLSNVGRVLSLKNQYLCPNSKVVKTATQTRVGIELPGQLKNKK